MLYKGFSLNGTAIQNGIIIDAINRIRFPWDAVTRGLRSKTGRTVIPVEWADLSAFGAAAKGYETDEVSWTRREHDDHTHDGEFDPLEHRGRVLGLAWYSGKVSVDITLVNQQELAKEVFGSEAAHMVDFFYMTEAQRTRIYNAYHGNPNEAPDPPHGCAWFDQLTYRDYVGEAFMGGFLKAYSNIAPTIPFNHASTPTVATQIRNTLTPGISSNPTVIPTTGPFFGQAYEARYHKNHRGLRFTQSWATKAEAEAEGRIPCRVCIQ